jgi:hypothetical protein
MQVLITSYLLQAASVFTTVEYIQNDKDKITMCLYQIFISIGENNKKTFKMLKVGFGE